VSVGGGICILRFRRSPAEAWQAYVFQSANRLERRDAMLPGIAAVGGMAVPAATDI
jgi:hypothetical protein